MRASTFSLSLAVFVFATLSLCAAPADATTVYVSAEDSGEIVVVDPDAGQVIARVPVGKRPRGVKLSRDGKQLFVALSGSPRGGPGVDESKLPPGDRSADGIGVVDLATNKLVRTLKSGQDPESFDLSPDGRFLFVSNEETAEASVLELQTGRIVRRIPTGAEPEGVTVRPDGRVVYVTSEQENQVVAIDAKKFSILARMKTGARPRSVIFAKDAKTAFVTDEFAGSLTVLDTVKNVSVGSIKIEGGAKTPLGPRPMSGVLSLDGKYLYVSCGRGELVAVVDVKARKIDHVIEGVGARPWGIGISPDGRSLFTANGPSDDVSVVDIASRKVTRKIKVGGLPWGIAVRP
jgi:YVTN family beta-propeller protein